MVRPQVSVCSQCDCKWLSNFINFACPLCIAVQDYVSTSQRVTFPPTVTSQTVMVSIVDDNVVESMEQFTALLSVPAGQSGVGLGVDTATVNIIDADGKFLCSSDYHVMHLGVFLFICDGCKLIVE